VFQEYIIAELIIDVKTTGVNKVDDLDRKINKTEKDTLSLNKALMASTVAFAALGATLGKVAKDGFAYSIEGREFKLISYGKLKMAVPKKATLLFDNGQYSGYAGCNGMGGKYELSGNKIKFYSGFSTMMACPDMKAETKFRKLLLEVDNYIMRDDILVFRKSKEEILNFKMQ